MVAPTCVGAQREFGQALLLTLIDGHEQLALPGEVVIHRALRDARGEHDLVERRRRIAVGGEQLARGGNESCSGGLGALALCAGHSIFHDCILDLRTIGLYNVPEVRTLTAPVR